MDEIMFHMKRISDRAVFILMEYLKQNDLIDISRDFFTLMGALWSVILLFRLFNGLRSWASPKYQGGEL